MKAEVEKRATEDALAERADELDEALIVFRAELAQDQFAPATGKFREAVNLTRAWGELRTRVLRAATDESKRLLPRNWRVAQALLSETVDVDSELAVPAELWDKVQAAKHDEFISGLLYGVDKIELHGSLENARDQLSRLVASHPGEPRLESRLRELNAKMARTAAAGATAETDPVVISAGLTIMPPKAVAPIVRETIVVPPPAGAANSKWAELKGTLTLVASTAMFGAAALLVWTHFSNPAPAKLVVVQPDAKTQNISPTAQPETKTAAKETANPVTVKAVATFSDAGEKAWQRIRVSQKPEDMEAFLKAYPASPHAVRARVKLSALKWEAVDKNDDSAVRAYLVKNEAGPYAAAAQALVDKADEEKAWREVDHSQPAALELFLAAFSGGEHSGTAQAELAALRAKAKAPTAPEKQ